MGASTVGKIVHETCQIIWDELVNEFMPVPSQEQLEKISDDFYRRWKFPNCIGCIDGKHCQTKCPVNSGSSYFNYLKYFSLVLQGVADADKKFITIEVGARGKQSDGGIFAASTLFQLLNTNTFNVPPDKELPGSTIKLPHVLIGDEAYPLKNFLMRPFPSRNLNYIRENYNKRLSAARKCVECAFGILRAKWRILGKDIEVSSDKASHIIKCVCILHNLIRVKDGDSDLHYCQEMIRQSQGNQSNELQERDNHGGARRGTTRAKEIRDEFANYFLDH